MRAGGITGNGVSQKPQPGGGESWRFEGSATASEAGGADGWAPAGAWA